MSETVTPAPQPSTPPARSRFAAHRSAIVLLVVAVLALGSLAFAPVRTLAADALGVFRVRSIETITITQADLEQMQATLEKGSGTVDLEDLGSITFDGYSKEPTESTLEAASAMVDFPVRVPQGVEGTPSVMVQTGGTIRFKLNVAKANELLKSYGADHLFSDSLDGKEFSVIIPTTVMAAYPAPGRDVEEWGPELVVAQGRSPQLIVPDGVNPLELRDVVVNLPFLPDTVRRQLAGITDWQNTLLLPNVGGSTTKTTIAGMPAAIIGEPVDPDMPAGPEYTPPVGVVWNDDGVLRAIGGPLPQAQIVKLAESMAR